jgi:hypothetical protein
MAIPILLTVAGLGAGWVVLSRERAKLATGAGAAPNGGDRPAQWIEDMKAAADAPGGMMIQDPGIAGSPGMTLVTDPAPTSPGAFVMGTNEANTSTGGSDPATQPSSLPDTATLYTGPTAPDENRASLYLAGFGPSEVVYGSRRGLTRQQEAAALAEVGPLSGLVY